MKKLILGVIALSVTASVTAAETSALVTKWTPNGDTTIINHKKGWAPVLTLKGDRGTGLVIDMHNKQADGILISSGNANLTINPSYVAAGVPGDGVGYSKETAAAVFKVSGSKLSGTSYIALDAKTNSIRWFDAAGNLVKEL
ncbi:hypothetical protein [Paraferrimonas sedimenticola]|uniref:Uncharacterized protein n=1 Tax=Paraferrimonas sedimenticola TaxID=375674 RepID=A0AA37W084_9GAMM|nr:hypothetical protein [Paraferrimonas sedimenticola]GLP96070.1 hypothetical protein GCM10007895_13760 [Paraferrimonas sedimenticola]